MIGFKHTTCPVSSGKGMMKRLCVFSVNSFLRPLREIYTSGKQ